MRSPSLPSGEVSRRLSESRIFCINDTFCCNRCDPKHFPALLNADGSWYFNTSIAEQTNVWLGGYHAIVREMLPVKYNLFLDEMILCRNRDLVATMIVANEAPKHAPS